MKKDSISAYFVFISVFTAITLFILLVQKSYSNIIGPVEQAKADQLLNNINPVLDMDVIKQIQDRKEFNVSSVPTISPVATPAVSESTGSSQINPTENE